MAATCRAEIRSSDLNPYTKRRIRSCGLKQSWVAYRDNARNLASYAVTDILPCSRLKNSSLFLSHKVRGIHFSISKLENEAQVIGGAPIGWFDAFEVRPWGTDLLRDSMEKVKSIQEKILAAQSRQK